MGQCPKRPYAEWFWSFLVCCFRFVSGFELRISDLGDWLLVVMFICAPPAARAIPPPLWTPFHALIDLAALMNHKPMPGQCLEPENFP